MLELTRAQVSPFRFEVVAGRANAAWREAIAYEGAGPVPLPLPPEDLTARVRNGLAGGSEPDVAELFLLDAERALHQGRFRETVLFCWSTIDTVFNRKYEDLVDAVLVGEWGDARAFLKGFDFHLRNNMSVGMHVVASRSFFREPGGLWASISTSYSKRNAIIHEGENASEDDARQAIDVAQRIVAIMSSIGVPGPPPAAAGPAAAASAPTPAPPPPAAAVAEVAAPEEAPSAPTESGPADPGQPARQVRCRSGLGSVNRVLRLEVHRPQACSRTPKQMLPVTGAPYQPTNQHGHEAGDDDAAGGLDHVVVGHFKACAGVF